MSETANADGDRGDRRRFFLRLPQVVERVGVCGATIRRWVKNGTFPRHRNLGANSVAWIESEVDDLNRPGIAGGPNS